jgi:hypothetical protein
MIDGTSHVVTQRRSHGIESLRIMQLDHRYASLNVDAQANQLSNIGATPCARRTH